MRGYRSRIYVWTARTPKRRDKIPARETKVGIGMRRIECRRGAAGGWRFAIKNAKHIIAGCHRWRLHLPRSEQRTAQHEPTNCYPAHGLFLLRMNFRNAGTPRTSLR